MADITINGISCSHQSIATAGWRGPNPFKRWFGSILPALAKHCGSRCGRNCLKGGKQLHYIKTEYHWQTSEAEVMLRYYWAVKHIIWLCLTHSDTFSLCPYCIWPHLHIYHCTSRAQVHSISLTQLFPLLPCRQPIYPPCYLFKFYVAPSQRVRKIVPWEKDNNNLWQCTWVKCPEVMKQLQAVTDGPRCKLSAASVTEMPNRQM